MRRVQVLLGLVLLMPGFAEAQVVVPNNRATTDGNLNNRFPFLVNAGQRYQQVYAADQFTAPLVIGRIAFRLDGPSSTAFSRTLSNVQIALSTTTNGPDALSATFADNLGPDILVVYSGSLTLSSLATPGPGDTRVFDISIELQTPFAYNPASGHLLLDVLNASPENNSINVFFDAEATTGDSISRLNGTEGQPGATTGSLNTAGLVTQFSAVAVPEPATYGLMVTLAAAAGLAIHYRREQYQHDLEVTDQQPGA
jgi:hypothetical protein